MTDEDMHPLPDPPEGPVAVSGAAGFIGRHLVARLVSRGVPVRALLLPSEEVPAPWQLHHGSADSIEVVRGDVTAPESLGPWADGARAIVHLAAVVTDWGPWELYRQVTIEGTENALRAAPADARFVLASSIVVYGHHLGRTRCDESVPFGRPQGHYGRAKQQQERLARRVAGERGLALSVVRPANVFGPGSRPWVEMVLPLLLDRQFTLLGGGDHDAGLCHVENLVDVLIAATTSPAAVGRTFNAADGEGVTWRRYFDDLARLVGAAPPRSLPRPLAGPVARASEALWSVARRPGRPPITREAVQLTARGLDLPTNAARDLLGVRPGVDYAAALDGLKAFLAGEGG